MNLNAMQQKAVLHTNGPLLILAGAGSGKTKVLTQRIANLIEKHNVRPWEILAITFTNKAALEMRERVGTIIGEEMLKDMWISTFHSMCVRILRRYSEQIGYTRYFTIYDPADQKTIIKDVLKELNINEKLFLAGAVLSDISNKKNQFILPKQALRANKEGCREHTLARIYDKYQDKLYENNAMDFDDLLVNVCILFNNHSDILEFYQRKFKYILVDEYQDTNGVQYELVRQLASKHQNLCVVGDDDQSIYGWRGADISNILEFEKDFANTTVIKLEQNYRSTKNILRAANEVVKNNCDRKEKTLFTENEIGEKIEIYEVQNEYKEAEMITAQLLNDINKYKKEYKDFAILYRTNAQSRILEEKMIQNSIPYRIFGGIRFYERKEIKDLIAYLKTIANEQDDIAVKRIINIPRRGIGAATIDKIQQLSNKHKINFYDIAKNIKQFQILGTTPANKILSFVDLIEDFKIIEQEDDVAELLHEIITKLDYINFIKETEPEDANDRILNIQELVSKAALYMQIAEMPSLNNFLEEIALVADIDNYDQDSNSVILMTLHSAKGLEFPIVFMPGFEDGLFPSYMSINDEDKTKLEEERRLCYVGITRAKEKLYILYTNERMIFGESRKAGASRFLNELPEEVIDIKTAFKKQANSSTVDKTFFSKNTSPFKSKFPDKSNYLYKKIDNIPEPIEEFRAGDTVTHRVFGQGIIIGVMKTKGEFFVTISFETGDLKKLNTRFAKLKKVR
ncbi:ATP-dependent DNA helicase PcrA [Candidatus Epulonipiscioides gigas]|nr:ATP-dependent DNA helicase PcrA [Epulopiscium sp. SCG-C07WGA-EpuloA2]